MPEWRIVNFTILFFNCLANQTLAPRAFTGNGIALNSIRNAVKFRSDQLEIFIQHLPKRCSINGRFEVNIESCVLRRH